MACAGLFDEELSVLAWVTWGAREDCHWPQNIKIVNEDVDNFNVISTNENTSDNLKEIEDDESTKEQAIEEESNSTGINTAGVGNDTIVKKNIKKNNNKKKNNKKNKKK